MRFSVGKSGAAPRLGLLSEVASNLSNFPTPNCLLYTKFGAVPFLTNDIVRQIDGLPGITFASLNFLREKHAVHKSFGNGLAKLSGLRELPVFLFQSDPTDIPVTRAVERSSISIWAVGGRLPVTMPQYAQCVVNALPAAFQLPVDNETSFRDVCAPGKKRCQKSVERTLGYASEIEKLRSSDKVLASIPMLVSVSGGNDLNQRLRGLAKTDFSKASGTFHLPSVKKLCQIIVVMGSLWLAPTRVCAEDAFCRSGSDWLTTRVYGTAQAPRKSISAAVGDFVKPPEPCISTLAEAPVSEFFKYGGLRSNLQRRSRRGGAMDKFLRISRTQHSSTSANEKRIANIVMLTHESC
nr:unnamed protein product [Spirometra erinaceieuropaei]